VFLKYFWVSKNELGGEGTKRSETLRAEIIERVKELAILLRKDREEIMNDAGDANILIDGIYEYINDLIREIRGIFSKEVSYKC